MSQERTQEAFQGEKVMESGLVLTFCSLSRLASLSRRHYGLGEQEGAFF
jgi:hypothetical protein